MFTKISTILAEQLSPGGGVARAIGHALVRGEITQRNASRHMTLLILETLSEHKPKNYPQPSGPLKQYVDSRLRGLDQRERTMAVKNGEWIQIIVRLRSQNLRDYDQLMWAGHIGKEMVSDEKLSEMQLSKLRNAVMEHVNQYDAFDWDYFMRALGVQEMDSDESRRSKEY